MGITIKYKSATKEPDKDPEDLAAKTADHTGGEENEPPASAPKKLRNDLQPKFTVETGKLSSLVAAKHPV